MYNGVGLKTARGSGTNAYVQKSLSFIPYRADDTHLAYQRNKSVFAPGATQEYEPGAKQDLPEGKPRVVSEEVLRHRARRQVEAECLELREELEAQGAKDIELQVHSLRNKLLSRLDLRPQREQAERKEREMGKWRKALEIGENYREGEVFERFGKRDERRRATEEEKREEARMRMQGIKPPK